MQPCPNCGGMGIDANGYCTQCRTYRGVPQVQQQPVQPPSSGVPYSGAPYSGAPYNAPAQQPYGGYPTSPGPAFNAQPTSGGAYPSATYGGSYGSPAPVKKRNSFMMPLLALSGVLLVLVVAIVVVVVVKRGGDDPTTPVADGSGSAQAKLVDDCVVGTWEMSNYTETIPVPDVGPVPFTLTGKGGTMTFGADGKGVQDYGSGTSFKGNVTVSGTAVPVTLKISGSLKFDFRTNDGGMTFSNMKSTASYVVQAPGVQDSASEDFDGSTDPSKYTCSGKTMTMSTNAYKSDLRKTTA
jgi:hypothetical protein